MMRSLFSGVSGLKAHQTGMDVIGNNIANVNTTGFKSSRTTFADMFSQTLTAAAGPSNNGNVGGTNPKQIGLGSVVASVDLLFTDGSPQSTGKNTDMALQGNGLFIVKKGNQTYYTRNGDFQFDASGNFVNSEGLYVQGWMAKDGVIEEGSTTSTNMTNLVVKAGKPMPQTKTTKTTYTNNLNSAAAMISGMTVLDGNGNSVKVSALDSTQWAVGTEHSATIDNMNVTFAGNITIDGAKGQYAMGSNYTVKGNTTVHLHNGDEVTVKPTSTARYTVGSAVSTAIDTLKDKAVTFKSGDTIASSNSTYTVTLNNGDTIAATSQTKNYQKGKALSDTDTFTIKSIKGSTVTLNGDDTLTNNSGTTYKVQVSSTGDWLTISSSSTYNYVNGATIPSVKSISGTRVTLSDGSVIQTKATNLSKYQGGTLPTIDGSTFQGLPTSTVASITADDAPTVYDISGTVTSDDGDDTFATNTSGAYFKAADGLTVSGLSLTDENGSVVTVSSSDTAAYKSSNPYNAGAPKSITLNMSDGSSVTETSGAYNIGYSMPVATTVKAYDSLGQEHDVTLYFTKTHTDSKTGNQWTASINPDGSGAINIQDDDGKVTKASMHDGTLQFDTDGKFVSGNTSMTLTLSNGADETQSIIIDLSNITQYAGSSTLTNTSDGNSAGILSSVSLDNQGRIIGSYTNDKKQIEGQVAVAQFANASGLTKSGNSLYQESNNSGKPNINTNTTLGVTLSTSALEMSNVDVATEFSNMIVTQRGFQSNSKIITVSDEMLETLINMKR